MNENHARQIVEYVDKKINSDRPQGERESYYSRSSHSEHDYWFEYLHDEFSDIFDLARDGEAGGYDSVAADLDYSYIVGHAMSAVNSELHETGGRPTFHYPSGHPKWFHGPLIGGWGTFSDKWDGDWRVPVGHAEKMREDLLVREAYEAYRTLMHGHGRSVFLRNAEGFYSVIEAKIPAYRQALEELHEQLKDVHVKILERIRLVCAL